MGITVTGPNGITIEFPDGTDNDTINRVMGEAVGKPAKPDVSMAESFGRGALQGMTFGTSDEIYAGFRGAKNKLMGGDFGPEYDTALKEVRGANERAKQANPLTYVGGEVAGGIALPMGAAGVGIRGAKAARDVTLAGRTVSGMKTGAVMGGAYGLGTAEGGEGSLLDQAGNRAVSAIPSVLVGGAAGAVLPAAVDAGTAIVKGATNAARASLAPQSMATQKVAEALARDRPEGAALDDAVAYAADRLQGARATKPGAVLADVGGQNTRDLLRTASNLPSPEADRMRRMLDARQGGQWNRIEQDLAETLSDGNRFGERLQKWTEVLKDVGKTEFDKAYSAPWGVRTNSDLGRFLTERGYMQRMIQKTGESIEGMTGERVGDIRPWELLHRVKMEIDREISRLKAGQGDAKANWTLRDLSALKREMVDLMGKENPQFRTAMERYGDAAGIKSALERGADEFKSARPEDLRAALSSMTRPEQMMYRAGAARSLFNEIEKGNITRDRTESLFSSPEIQKKLAAIFPSQAQRRDFQRRLVLEAKMADTRKAVQGNSTTARQLAQGGEAGQPVAAMNAVSNLGSGRFGQVLDYLSRQVQRFHGMTPATANETIKILMSKGALGTEKELQAVIDRAAREPEIRDALTRRILSGIAAGNAAVSSPEQRANQ